MQGSSLHPALALAVPCPNLCRLWLLMSQPGPLWCNNLTVQVVQHDIFMRAGHTKCCQQARILSTTSILHSCQAGALWHCACMPSAGHTSSFLGSILCTNNLDVSCDPDTSMCAPQRCRGRRLRPCRWCACPGRRTHCPTAACLQRTAPNLLAICSSQTSSLGGSCALWGS